MKKYVLCGFPIIPYLPCVMGQRFFEEVDLGQVPALLLAPPLVFAVLVIS